MSIKFAILGLLSWKPSTGYDLKKIFEESAAMYWSGNNNQIYTTLLGLQRDNLLSVETIQQENAPPRKIYTITELGKEKLKEWVKSNPEPPELKKTFLIQLAWADCLSDEELNRLLSQYEYEVKMQLILQQEKERRGMNLPNRTERERILWKMISENTMKAYESELHWIASLREQLNIK